MQWCGITADLYAQQILIGVTAVSQGSVSLFQLAALLNGECLFDKNSAAVCGITADLYAQQILIGVTCHQGSVSLFCRAALCCGECVSDKNKAAVHWCGITADLYAQQIFIGVTAVSPGVCQPVLQSSAVLWRMRF